MKEDILEQIADDYLQFKGCFTTHNVRFKPDPAHPDLRGRPRSRPIRCRRPWRFIRPTPGPERAPGRDLQVVAGRVQPSKETDGTEGELRAAETTDSAALRGAVEPEVGGGVS